ncbi:MAG: hypothetical protein L0K86_17475 [Actinomycetia bacterium]|nr:hypothetical protein [Actinomycetes bacterium]
MRRRRHTHADGHAQPRPRRHVDSTDGAFERGGVREGLGVGAAGQEDGCLIAAEASDDIDARRGHHCEGRDLDQYSVTNRMSVRVVDALEAVDVGEHERDRLMRMALSGERLERGGEDASGCESGQAVDVRLVAEPVDERELAGTDRRDDGCDAAQSGADGREMRHCHLSRIADERHDGARHDGVRRHEPCRDGAIEVRAEQHCPAQEDLR